MKQDLSSEIYFHKLWPLMLCPNEMKLNFTPQRRDITLQTVLLKLSPTHHTISRDLSSVDLTLRNIFREVISFEVKSKRLIPQSEMFELISFKIFSGLLSHLLIDLLNVCTSWLSKIKVGKNTHRSYVPPPQKVCPQKLCPYIDVYQHYINKNL